jgi:hypothetical protein
MKRYCPDECGAMQPTERDQVSNSIPHMCIKYDKKLLHLDSHPKLYRCKECVEDIPNGLYCGICASLFYTKTAILCCLKFGEEITVVPIDDDWTDWKPLKCNGCQKENLSKAFE